MSIPNITARAGFFRAIQSVFQQGRQDFSQPAQALASGNLSQAQSVFSQLESDLKSALQNASGQASGITGPHRGHHGHHHHGSAVENSSNSSTSGARDAGSQTDTSNGNVNLTA